VGIWPRRLVLAQIPQKGGVFTAGLLATQTWSFAGPATINTLFLQPFTAFTFPNTVTINLQSQSTLNWNQGQWTVPIIASVSKIFKLGDQLTSIGLGVKREILSRLLHHHQKMLKPTSGP
jgi:hypothetical protein